MLIAKHKSTLVYAALGSVLTVGVFFLAVWVFGWGYYDCRDGVLVKYGLPKGPPPQSCLIQKPIKPTTTLPPRVTGQKASFSCSVDSDCTLVINSSWDSCELDLCIPADYSLEKWIAVNQEWYSQRIKGCQLPAVMCDPKPVNDKFTGRCINSVCQKRPLPNE